MSLQNAARAAPATTGRDPQAIDRHGGAIDLRPTPQTTIEAIMWCVRERGLAALKERINQERLSRCDAAARQQINKRIERLKKAGVVL
jgi:hypothetical protein